MSYTALYRKFRPDSFSDVKGQDHIVTTLKNQINSERIGHAYLFCGTRGTGKTTIAKIFAKAVNCENPENGSPCGKCQSCLTIAAGASMNVIEIDAASNNGVDNIREIRDEVSYSPAEGKYKVYIIDEVHMLSIGAFNALLKTLEEPPAYVIFILATTEVHKIPITILSRCQRYDFKRISIDIITERLRELATKEETPVEDKALRFIAKAADGSMRDALSLMDQCMAFYFGEELTYDKAMEVLGAVDTGVYSELLRIIMKQDIIGAIHLLEDLIMRGRELGQFVIDFTWYMRNLMLAKTSENMEDVIDVSSENLQRLKEEAQMTELPALMRYIRIFSELSGQIKYASQKRVLIEMALIKLCKPSMETDMESVLQRIRCLEEQVEKGISIAYENPTGNSGGIRAETGIKEKREKVPLPAALPEEIRKVAGSFKKITDDLDGLMKSTCRAANLTAEGDRLILVFEDPMKYKIANEEKNRLELVEKIEESIGKTVEIDVRLLSTGQIFDETYPDISKLININIEVED